MTATIEPDVESDVPIEPDRASATRLRVRVVARSMVAFQVVLVTWACFHGWFFNDDYVFRGQGARYGWFDPAYLMQPWGGHLMPAGFAVAQVLAKLGDFSYLGIAVSLAAGQAFVAVLLYRFLFRHFGVRWRVLLPLALYLTSIPMLQATVWWAAALNAVPLLACMVVVADHTLRLARRRSLRDYAWVIGTVAASLAFFEKSVLLVVVVGFLLLATTPGAKGRPSVLLVARRHAVLWVGLAAVLAGWYLVYRGNKTAELANLPNLPTLSDQLSIGLAGTFVPSLFGGPWDWAGAVNGYTLVGASPWIVVLLCVVLAAVAFVLSSTGPRARVALLMVVAYAMALVVLVNVGRSQFLVATSGLPRYYADLTMVAVLALALSTARLTDDPAPSMLHELRPRASRRALIVAAAVGQVWLLSWLVAAVSLGSAIGNSAEIPWVTTALRTLRTTDSQAAILDRAVPVDVLSPLATPYTTYGWFFAGVRGMPPVSDETDRLRILDDTSGALIDAHVAGPASADRPRGQCGWQIGHLGVWVPMVNQIVNWRHTMHIAYVANVATAVEVRMAEGTARVVHVQPGLHDLYATVDMGGQFVNLRPSEPGATLCVDKIEMGEPAPGLATP
jgi:hypothetical protein